MNQVRFNLLRLPHAVSKYYCLQIKYYLLFMLESPSQVDYEQGVIPTFPEPEKLESLLSIAAQHGYVSVWGYARLSGLFFLHSELDRSIDVLLHAVKDTPNEILLHEILADSLSTVGRQEEAITHYQMCANLDSSALRIRQKMGKPTNL